MTRTLRTAAACAALVALTASATVGGPAAAAAAQDAPRPQEATVFAAGTDGYDTFRIPAVVEAANGDLLAFAEGRRTGAGDTGDIDLVLRRSGDGGRGWGPLQVVGDNGPNTFGNPVPVVDPGTGRVVLLSTHNAGDAHESAIRRGEVDAADSRRVWVQYSDDDGATWSEPREITADVKRPDWRWYATGPVHGTALEHGPHAGRLVVPANHSAAPPEGSGDQGDEDAYYGAHLLYSDDGGGSWHIGAVDDSYEGEVNGNETTVAELPDGTLYVNSRDQNGTAAGTRATALSTDGGASFATPLAPDPELTAPVVQGSSLQTDRGPLLFAAPADPSARRALTVRASTDGGASWPRSYPLSAAPAAYSDLVEINAATVGVLYETGTAGPYERIAFHRLRLRP